MLHSLPMMQCPSCQRRATKRDGYDGLPAQLSARTNRYLNNVIERDHRHVKQRVRPILGFKRFAHAAITISGIELVHQIKKGQFDVLVLCPHQSRTPQIWEAVLAA
jgi:transposase-like protein